MIKLILLTGFLGTGKTTLLQSILNTYKDHKIGVIENEFGAVNIDAVLLKNYKIKITELSNGSIFCACIKDSFVTALIEMSAQEIDYLIIESSGLSDPANITAVLQAIEPRTVSQYDYRGSICIVDAETFMDLYDVLPALHNQVEYSSVTIINKADLAKDDEIMRIKEKLQWINPAADVFITTYCKVDTEKIMGNIRDISPGAKDSTNSVESRPNTFVLGSYTELPYGSLVAFITVIANSAYRIKGFAKTDNGPVEISAVGERVKISKWNEPVGKTEIVVMSAVGIRMVSEITNAIVDDLKGKIYLE